jgi:peptidoglycan/LPS O-acetylase OafA/YrhL
MAQEETPRKAPGEESPRVNAALGIAAVAVALFIVAIVVAQEGNDWLWPLTGVVGAVAAITGWSAHRPRPRGRALIAVVVGGLLFALVAGWGIVGAITGNL